MHRPDVEAVGLSPFLKKYLLGDNRNDLLYLIARLGWQQQLVGGPWEISSREVHRSQIRSYCNIILGHCSNIVRRQVHISYRTKTHQSISISRQVHGMICNPPFQLN